MAADGVDRPGGRLVDAMVPPAPDSRRRGTGRVGAALPGAGNTVVGWCRPALARRPRRPPGPRWLVADLAELDLAAAGEPEPFDAAVVAGNVMAFVAPGTEPEVLRRLANHLRPDGVALVGFGLDRGYRLADFDHDVDLTGLRREHRFATWDLRPWHEESDFAVTVLRRPAD